MKFDTFKFISIQLNVYPFVDRFKKGYGDLFVSVLGYNVLIYFSHKKLKKQQKTLINF